MLKKTNSCKHVRRYTKLLRMLSVKIHAKEHAPEVVYCECGYAKHNGGWLASLRIRIFREAALSYQ